MKVAIVDYKSGNLHSASKAFARAADEAGIDVDVIVTAEAETVAAADRIVLPGVGAFGHCRDALAAVPGMWDAVDNSVKSGRPFFGICVGMQLMATRSLEFGEQKGFGWIAGDVEQIDVGATDLKVPHMGWNELELGNAPHPVLAGLPNHAHAYFVHSFHLKAANQNEIVATTDYGGPVTAAVARDNLFGTQFHPEKSQAVGLQIISNFLSWSP